MIRMEVQSNVFGSFTEFNLVTGCAFDFKLSVGYSHAAQLSWTMNAPGHTTPIPRLAFIRVWDDAGTLEDGTTAQDADHPMFEGFVESVTPAGANELRYVAFDPTYRVAAEVITMSAAWVAGTPDPDPGEQVPPTPGIGAIPRLVYNAVDEADPDYANNVGANGTIGQIIAGILEFSQEPLWWRNAVPGSLMSGSQLGYVSGDLSGLTFTPQEKIVWETESVRAATERLQRYEPRVRLVWHPGERLWRFRDITTATAITLNLNDPTIPHPVDSLELNPSMDRAYTAIKIYGPPTTVTEEFIWIHPDVAPEDWTNTLQPVGSPIVLETIGANDIVTYAAWQIIDATKRRSAHLLPDWYALRTNQYTWENVKYPQFLLSWDGGSNWTGASNAFLNFLTGTASFPATAPYATVENQVNLIGDIVIGQHYFPPNAAMLLWAPFIESLSVRVPETGFQGTAYTVGGLKLEKVFYDEQLAIGYEYGQPVTSEARIEQMEALATSQLEKNQDICWTGGCQLRGIDWRWLRLNRRVNFTVNDGSGGTVSAGWDGINAFVTDMEIDFENLTTTVTFSSDRQEALGEDPAALKQRLGIRDLRQVAREDISYIWRTMFNWRGEAYQELAGVNINTGFDYVDPTTGLTVFSD